MEAFEKFDKSFAGIAERNGSGADMDPFVVAQGVGIIFRVIAGDMTAIEEIVNDPVLGGSDQFRQESEEAVSTLVSDVRAIGCELEPTQIIMKGISGAIQRAIIEDAVELTDFDSAITTISSPETASLAGELDDDVSEEIMANARQLDDITARLLERTGNRHILETPEQNEQRILDLLSLANEASEGARELIGIVKREEATDMEQARSAYIQAQGWDPDKLDFSQRLDTKMHLKSLGFRVS